MVPSLMMGRLPEYFSEPDRFIPERWSKENKAAVHPFTVIPFGFGPRMCIGEL